MKFNLYKELLSENNILSHIFLNCVEKGKLESFADDTKKAMDADPNLTSDYIEENRVVEMKLFVEGEEVDLRKFFEMLWDEYEYMVKSQATEIVKEQTSDKLNDISSQIMHLQDCANDLSEHINWEVENPFVENAFVKQPKKSDF